MPSPQQAEIGRLTHLGVVLALRREIQRDDLSALSEIVTQVTHASFLAMSRRAVIIIRTGIATYLRHFVPAEPWFLHGAEVHVAGRRVDLGWRHPDGRSFFDELKTQPFTLMTVDPHVREQVDAYV